MMIENVFLHVSGHIGDTILCNVARSSATPEDSFMSLAISLTKSSNLAINPTLCSHDD
jgi:hypothetical protein